jgi:hypothetical protein
MKTYGEWRKTSTILHLGTRWRLVVSFTTGVRASYPVQLHDRGKSLLSCCLGGLVGPRAGLDDVEKTKILHLPGIESLPPNS